MLRENKRNTNEVLFTKALINSYISHDEFVSVNNVVREYIEMKEKIMLKLLWNILYKYGWYKQKTVWKKWYRSYR